MAARIPARLSATAGSALSEAEGRRFGLTVGGAFLALAALLWWRHHPTRTTVAAVLGALLVLAALAAPGRLGPVYRAWMALGHAISRVTTPIFLGVVYFLVFTPVALVRRATGRNALMHREQDGGFWIGRTPGPGPRSDLRRQF